MSLRNHIPVILCVTLAIAVSAYTIAGMVGDVLPESFTTSTIQKHTVNEKAQENTQPATSLQSDPTIVTLPAFILETVLTAPADAEISSQPTTPPTELPTITIQEGIPHPTPPTTTTAPVPAADPQPATTPSATIPPQATEPPPAPTQPTIPHAVPDATPAETQPATSTECPHANTYQFKKPTTQEDRYLLTYCADCQAVIEKARPEKLQLDGTRKDDVSVDLTIAFPVEEESRQVATQIDATLETFAKGTATELTLQIFDYLDGHAVYSNAAAKPSDTLRSGKGFCNAFAILFRQMCLRLGIPCDMVVGYTASGSYHAWNRILTETGEWRYIDIPFWKIANNEKYRGGLTPIHDAATYNCYSEE